MSGTEDRTALDRERFHLLVTVEAALERPMTLLAIVWLALVVVDLTRGLTPLLVLVNQGIWALFILHFLLEFTIAPQKWKYVKRNWLTALALLLPALRIVRIARVVRMARAARGVRLVRVVGSVNRGMRTLGRVMSRRSIGYVLLLTALVNVLGAAGMLTFERNDTYFNSFASALWWTAMTLTTMGSDFFPLTPEGRLLGLLLAVYGFAVFGYVTAAIASFFVAQDAEEGSELANAQQIAALHDEIVALRQELGALSTQNTGRADG